MEKLSNSGSSDQRKTYEERFALQAKERNSHRPTLQKVLRQNAVSGTDMAREEAEKVNNLLRRTHSESPQDASDEILKGKEFGAEAGSEKDAKRIKFQEWLRAKFPKSPIMDEVEQSLEFGHMNKRFIQGLGDSMTESEEEDFIEGIKAMVSDKIDTMIRANNRVAMESVLSFELHRRFGELELVAAPDVARMPIDLLEAYKENVQWFLESYLKETIYPDPIVVQVLEQLKSKVA